MTINVTDTPAVRDASPLTPSLIAGIANYNGMTAAERRAHVEEWTRVRDPNAGLIDVPVVECCGAVWLPGERCDHRSADAATLAGRESSTWCWSAPDRDGA